MAGGQIQVSLTVSWLSIRLYKLDNLSNGFAISSPPLFSERYHGALPFPSPLATFDQATVVQTYLGFAAFIEPLPIDHIMIPEAMEEDILGEGVTFRVTESFLSFPLSRRSQNTRDLVALKRVKAPQYLLERAEKQSIEKVCFELRVLLHQQIRIHPNIVNIICIAWEMQGSDPYDQIPSPVLVMEHAAFGALSTYQSSNELSWVQKRRISLEVARGLEVLHDSGIIHGDIKSENVLLFPSNDHGFEAKLSDFGASLLDDDYESTVKIIGTRIWSAPETLSGPVLKEWAPAADVYSFGLLCFRICMDGKNPFWALPIFDLDPDLSSIEVLKQIQELKLRSDFVDMCLQYAVRDELAEFPLVKIIGTSLGQSPSQRNNVKSLVQDLQGFKV
jgi:serine/threonine protein kinase